MFKSTILFLGLVVAQYLTANAQCGSIINTFPYNESFEASQAGWISGGILDDWAWGIPSKSYIQNAGTGLRCWVTGSLSGSFYNLGERSFVESPCFDFTTIANPHVKMKIYWESENTYDGATFQYTINNGVTWLNVGSNTDPIDCLNENWFNQSNINGLGNMASPRHGWAGTVLPTQGNCAGGSGSLGWVVAQHCMPYLAGQPNVQFRFAFGAGTQCNNYDGFGFDDITIGEAPSNSADFAFNCTSTSLQYQFTNTSTLCPSSLSWNFGDPSSGMFNTATGANPIHTFTSSGSYIVTLTANGPCNAISTISKTINTIASNSVLTAPACFGSSNGSINSSASNTSGIVTYTLQPGNTSNLNGNFSGLNAGSYTVTVVDAAGCNLSASVVLNNPVALQLSNPSIIPITCSGLQNASITATASGGTGNINYMLMPNGISNLTGIFSNLASGNYTVIASDANGCSSSTLINIANPLPIVLSTSVVNLLCNGANSGQLQTNATGGSGGVNSFLLLPTGATSSNGLFTGLSGGIYTVIASDANACTQSATALISEPAPIIVQSVQVAQPQCTPNNSGGISVLASGGVGTLEYSIGGAFSTSNNFNSMISATYTVVVRDANSCTVSTTVTLQNADAPSISNALISPELCFGDSNAVVQIIASSINTITGYELTPGGYSSQSGTFMNLGSGNYTVVVSDAKGCTATSAISINAPLPLEIVSVQYSNDSCGASFYGTLEVTGTGGSNQFKYRLMPTNIDNSTGVFALSSFGTFTVTVLDSKGCSASRNLIIEEKLCCDGVFIPNAFTPNADGTNDELRLLNTAGIEIIKFIILDRWGNAMFETKNAEFGWNGNFKGVEVSTGSFYYLLQYRCKSDGKEVIKKGDLLLLR